MSENVQVMDGELKVLSPKESLKNDLVEMTRTDIGLGLSMTRNEHDSIERTEQIIPPAVTRFIDLLEKNEKTGAYEVRKDSFGHPIDIMGALGNIPASQMPYMQVSNMNHISIVLEDDIYFTIYEKDDFGNIKLDKNGKEIIIYRHVINLGQETQITQLLNNLAYEYRTAKLQGQVMVGQSGGNPIAVGGSWDNTLDMLFGGNKKK
jgi:hypothetical protein